MSAQGRDPTSASRRPPVSTPLARTATPPARALIRHMAFAMILVAPLLFSAVGFAQEDTSDSRRDPAAALEGDLPEDTLVARLPLGLGGDIDAWSRGATIRAASDDAGIAPRMELGLHAPHANVYVTNWTYTESSGILDRDELDQANGNTDPFEADDVSLRINDLGHGFIMVVHDGALEGARYHSTATNRAATLDLLEEPLTLGYTDDPRYLDFEAQRPSGSFAVRGSDMFHEVTGDFTIFLFDTTATVLEANGTHVFETGRWVQETGDPAGALSPARRTTTTTYVQLEVFDATLTLSASGGRQHLLADAEEIAIGIDGEITSSATTGSLRMGDRHVRATGDTVRATGEFLLVPTYVVDLDDREAVFAMTAQLRTLSVGQASFSNAGTLAAATGLGLALTAIAAYFWQGTKMTFLVPLYAKLTKDKVLDQGTRNDVHEKVAQDPGCQVQDIADALGVSWTTAAYHVRVLRKMGLLVGRQKGRHMHLFVAGSGHATGFEAMAAIKNDTARDILALVMRRPGIIQKELCDQLGIAASTASWHMGKLRDSGLIREEKEWKMRRYYAGPAAAHVPLHLGAPDAIASVGVSA